MENVPFWSLIGTVAGTLAGLAFAGLSVYYNHLQGVLGEAKRIGLRTTRIETFLSLSVVSLILLLLPFVMSVLSFVDTSSVKWIYFVMLIFLLVAVISMEKSFGKIALLNINVLRLCILVIAVILTLFTFTPKESLELRTMWEASAIAMLFIGLMSIFYTVNFVDRHRVIFEIGEEYLTNRDRNIYNLQAEFYALEERYKLALKQSVGLKRKFGEAYTKPMLEIQNEMNRVDSELNTLKKLEVIKGSSISLSEAAFLNERFERLLDDIRKLDGRIMEGLEKLRSTSPH